MSHRLGCLNGAELGRFASFPFVLILHSLLTASWHLVRVLFSDGLVVRFSGRAGKPTSGLVMAYILLPYCQRLSLYGFGMPKIEGMQHMATYKYFNAGRGSIALAHNMDIESALLRTLAHNASCISLCKYSKVCPVGWKPFVSSSSAYELAKNYFCINRTSPLMPAIGCPTV